MSMNGQAPKLLGVREITGRIEAILSWVPDPLLRSESDGTQLHLSSHILSPIDGQVILFDGPRAAPGLGPDGNLCVLPLSLPDQPGRYRILIEAVAEGRFWASQLGYTPLVIETERCLDGSLLFDCGCPGNRHVANRSGANSFSIDSSLYGVGDSERCVEIPWCVSRFRGESKVLDVGYANAEPRYLLARNALKIPCLIGLDMATLPQSGILGVVGDVLVPPFRPETFDLIFAISVVEHIGRDNSIYYDRRQPIHEFGDLNAAVALASLLRPAGRLLVTLPFGRFEDHLWFVQYDVDRIDALLNATGCDLILSEYYAYSSDGWHGPVDPLTLSNVGYRTGLGAGAVACLELSKVS
jgi:SAM-dependent methyltransferase